MYRTMPGKIENYSSTCRHHIRSNTQVYFHLEFLFLLPLICVVGKVSEFGETAQVLHTFRSQSD